MASAYVEIKGEFDKGNNEAVVEKLSNYREFIRSNGISKNIDEFKDKAQAAIAKITLIDENSKIIGIILMPEFDSSTNEADELLKMNLKEREKKKE